MIVTQIDVGQIVNSVIQPLFSLLPSVLTAVLIVGVGVVVGTLLDDRVYEWARDRAVDQKAAGTPAGPFASTDDAVARTLATVSQYATYLLAAVLAVGVVDLREVDQIVSQILAYTPDFVGAVVVLLVGFGLGRLVGPAVQTAVGQFRLGAGVAGTVLGEAVGIDADDFDRLAGTVVAFYVYLLTVFVAAGLASIAQLTGVLGGLVAYYPVAVGGGLVVAVGAVVAEFVGQRVRAAPAVPDSPLVGRVTEAAVYLFAAVIALDVVGVATGLLTTLLLVTVFPVVLAAAVAAGIAFGYGGRDTAGDYVDRRFGE